MEGEFTKLLLVTANVGSIFEDPEHMLKIWLKEFLAAIQDMEPGMVAIHCQEVGGKNYEASMQHVNQFVKAMLGSDELAKYDRARVFLDEDYTAADKFTALGNLYFIHECVEDVMIFDFIECKFLPVEGREVLSGNIENIQIKEKSKYPQNFFPDFKWSRKGFLRTRWSINNCVFDLINLHLFHDASNLIAMQKSPSTYVENRYRALAHTLQRFDTDQFDKVPYFLFGDFNFRLDLNKVLKVLTEKSEVHETKNKKDQISKLVYTDSDKKVVLTLESKNFDHHEKHNEVFANKNKLLNQFDLEFAAYKDKLLEYPIDFPPSYPFSEDVDDGLSYMKTRCPSWCDRILLSPATKDIIQTHEKHKPKYAIIGQDVCMGDHKPVYLSLLLRKGKGKHPEYKFQTSYERRQQLSKTISINGESVEFQKEVLNIHDFAEFEKAEELIPEFRASLKTKLNSQSEVDEPEGDLDARKTPSFQDIAKKICMLETALSRWPNRRPRSRHHSSSSEDMVEDVGAKSPDDNVSVHTDVSELSDVGNINVELKDTTNKTATLDSNQNTNANLNGNSAGNDGILQSQKMVTDPDTSTDIRQRRSNQNEENTRKSKLLLMHEQGKVEHEHDTGKVKERSEEAGLKKAGSSSRSGRQLRCPSCVVL